jgi:2-amino-4-hydroxy-6-hydroxymethyldihydropteridine diphosphokinase
MPEPKQAIIGIGANLGDRWATITGALKALRNTPGIAGVEISAVYETAPVGVTDQPPFLNLVAGLETTLTPEQLLVSLRDIERDAGRQRGPGEIRWGPRTLDLDMLLYEGEVREGPELILPHPRMWERAFVTIPLRELFSRAAQFHRPAWAEARARMEKLPADGPGVHSWTPPAK